MKERRQYERFTIPLPVRMETITLGRKEVLDLETRDISASRIFITTLSLPPIEVGYQINPLLPIIPLAMKVHQVACGEPHSHPRAQLIYASHGVMRVISKGDIWVIPPSQSVWVPSMVEHQVLFPGTVYICNLFIDSSVTSGLPKRCCVLNVPSLLRELIQKAIEIGEHYPPEGPERRVMDVILDELRLIEPSPLHLPMAKDIRVKRVMDALIAEPGDERSLERWASVAAASSRTLARLFIKETGMTFGEWRRQLRLMEAIDRLGKGYSVTQVSIELGYQSLSGFIEMFRKALGKPPGQFFRI